MTAPAKPDVDFTGALCAETDPDLFFPEAGGNGVVAKTVCGRCPAVTVCLEYALQHEVHGVWGGTTESDRKRLAAAAGRTYKPLTTPTLAGPAPRACGTEAGAARHRRAGEPPCTACREAANAAAAHRASRRPRMSGRRVRRDHTDPRRAGGDIAGPGGPKERDQVVIDATDGVLLDAVDVATVRVERDGVPGEEALALMLSGRINKTTEQSRVLYLMDRQGAASLLAEVLALHSRAGQSEQLTTELGRALDTLRGAGAL